VIANLFFTEKKFDQGMGIARERALKAIIE
jgi:hypothetical protein